MTVTTMRYLLPARATVTLLALLGLLVSSMALPPEAHAVGEASPADQLKVWNVNIRHLGRDDDPPGRWRKFLDVMEADHFKPDVILVQEIGGGDTQIGTFIDGVRNRFAKDGDSYYYRHATGGNAVVWRSPRLKINTSRTSTDPSDNEVQWPRWAKRTRGGECEPDTWDEVAKKAIGVRLWDTQQKRTVVAASIHWSPHNGSAYDCMEKNVRRLDYKLETGPNANDPWSVRQLTIVGGDFNQHPAGEDKTTTGDELASGSQVAPECWYTTFSATDPDAQLGCEQEERVDTYYDAVWERHRNRTNADSGLPEMCHQWTRRPTETTGGGHACTDHDGNGRRDGSRIDYIWARWEYAGGGVKSFSQPEAHAMIPRARRDKSCVDEGCADTRYSDHRGVTAVLRWCPPDNDC